MDRCRELQELMLEYLYDLVEDDQRAALAAHLEACAPCQAALSKAQKQQQLLASAARRDFPAVTFAPPAAAAIPPTVTLSFTSLDIPTPDPERLNGPDLRAVSFSPA